MINFGNSIYLFKNIILIVDLLAAWGTKKKVRNEKPNQTLNTPLQTLSIWLIYVCGNNISDYTFAVELY